MSVAAIATSRPSKLWDCFTDDRTFWRFAAVVLGALSVIKGLRAPNRWSATQALVNYDHGLVKRGLFGATLGRWLHLERYVNFAIVSYLLLAVLLGMLAWLTWSSGALDRLGSGEPVALFFSSFAVTYLAHLVGYFEILLAILTVALLLVREARVRFLVAVPLCIGALLIHELFLIVFLPVILFSFVVDGLRATTLQRRHFIWGSAGILLLICVIVTGRLALEHPATDHQVQTVKAELAARADFPVRDDFFTVLHRSAIENFGITLNTYRRLKGFQLRFAVALVVFAPVVFLLAMGIVRAVRCTFEGAERRIAMVAAAAAAGSPFLMHAIGWDAARWDALVCLDSFLVLLVLGSRLSGPGLTLPAGYRNAVILVIALSMVTGESLMDGRTINTYPFTRPAAAFMNAVRHHTWARPAE